MAAFDKNPLKVSEYLHAQIELSLLTPLKEISYLDLHDLSTKVRTDIDGLYISHNDKSTSLLLSSSDFSNSLALVTYLFEKAGISTNSLLPQAKVYTFNVEKSHDEPILA